MKTTSSLSAAALLIALSAFVLHWSTPFGGARADSTALPPDIKVGAVAGPEKATGRYLEILAIHGDWIKSASYYRNEGAATGKDYIETTWQHMSQFSWPVPNPSAQ